MSKFVDSLRSFKNRMLGKRDREVNSVSKHDLVSVIAQLRRDLATSVQQAAGEDIRFEVGEIEVELAVEVEAKAGGGIQVWVVNLGADASRTRSQTIKIPLTPKARDGKPIFTSGTVSPQ